MQPKPVITDPLTALMPLIQTHTPELKRPGVIAIRPGYRMEDGWPTTDPAIVVVVSQTAGDPGLPAQVEGVPVDVRQATDVEELRFQDPGRYTALAVTHPEIRGGAFPEADPSVMEAGAGAEAGELERGATPQIPYTPAPGVVLQTVSGKVPIVCHVSPDCGWPTLRDFLAATQTKLTVSMYDFTSKHILDAVEQDLRGNRQLTLTLDHPATNPTADQTDPETISELNDTLGAKFQSAWALVRSNPDVSAWIYPTAYHIKVAVRDSRTVWLSSGNWNNSNQPDMDPINHPASTDQALAKKSDRDWHIIIENAALARQFEAYLEHDFEVASTQAGGTRGEPVPEVEVPEEFRGTPRATFVFHKPLSIDNEELAITPLLTPDPGVYQMAMFSLLQSAQTSLYIQLQYIHPSSVAADAPFKALIDAVAGRIGEGVDVRIILSEYQKSNGWLDRLQAAGIDLSKVKIQNGVHNKGFVIDSRVVALGSQNWSADGVLQNRDASVIIENETAAKYYEQIFLHDWDRIAQQSVK